VKFATEVDTSAWDGDAACRGQATSIWFPELKGGPGRADPFAEARMVCRTCPVSGDCLAHALRHERDSTGMWGGLTLEERRQLRRDQLRWRRAS
jgi:WhiB family redox-sensing transcriptional regulator